MKKIESFDEEYRFLSNFWPCTFIWKGLVWKSVENAYQCAKSEDLPFDKFKNLTPSQAKKEGQKLTLRNNWEQMKFQIMYELVLAKFNQNKDLKDKLIDTGNAILEEGNYWKDTFWGIYPKGSGIGNNVLGKILMRIRKNLGGK